MARFFSLLALLFAAALANESATKQEEFNFRQEMLKNLNRTNEKLEKLMTIIFDQVLETRKVAEEQTKLANQTLENTKQQNQKLEELSRIADRHFQSFMANCNVARLATNVVTLSNGKNYYFDTNAKTWAGAKDFCTQKGLQLASIADENDVKVVGALGHNLWVSAKSEGSGSQKVFRWQDGTKLELNSSLWKEDADKTQECVRIYNWSGGTLNSHSCTDLRPFICQMPSECVSEST
ncbi:C-type lectin domain family 4 member F-like [Neocloeon triangulifer]|uniref:C-type lectin domain family 4 member F-like n=1 Tax=Neocloeon triangulifer TaxID=2078957 RepID=UPI00286FA7F2|nr:C-type lectin domain family 4 member F-like [Neocloeon triangulifer]